VAESTHYNRQARKVTPSQRELDDAALLEQICKVRAAHEFAATYGSPRCGWNYAAKVCESGANASSGSCAPTGCRALICAAVGRAAPSGQPLRRDAIRRLVDRHVATAAQSCPSLTGKAVSPHTLRHSCAMWTVPDLVDTRS
jgi:hypothetical protein